MSAVWRAARAAVRRRRLQTIIIGVVALVSTATIVVALGLLEVTSAPFDHAFAKQHGAHIVATFDSAKVSEAQLGQTVQRPGVEGAAGPFAQAVITIPSNQAAVPPVPLTVVGRADPGGPVDHLNLWAGHWATEPGQIVVSVPPGGNYTPGAMGSTIRVPGGPALAVVGFAYSVSESAGAWVSPDQIAALHPSATQMLYRFTVSSTENDVRTDLAAVTTGLPSGSLVASQSYLVLKQAYAAGPGTYVPFLMAFGFLGLVVAVLIIANVVSGAVVSGFRHIGVLKALGFTPNQVVAVYLAMVSVPAAVGSVLGTVLGNVLAQPLLSDAVQGFALGTVSISPWVDVVSLLGMPAVAILTALVPALRANRLPTARAISAGSAQRAGRGLRIQRRLTGTRLPRSVSLGLGLPFTRPGRTVLTMAGIVLGVTTVTLATGLTSTATKFGDAEQAKGAVQVTVRAGGPGNGQAPRKLSDPAIESLLRSLPGAVHVTAELPTRTQLVGYTQSIYAHFLRGDSSTLGYVVVKGHWMDGPGEAVVAPSFLRQRGLAVGDHLTLDVGGKQAHVTIVGEIMVGDPGLLFSDWQTLAALAPGQTATEYEVQLAHGTDVSAYIAAFRKAAGPGLYPTANPPRTNPITVLVVSFASLFMLMLGTVAALGVFNTVVLNAQERRRDLGMLKSIGMTPRQVTVMMVTSMAALGAVGGLLGLPLGIAAHRLIVPASVHAGGAVLPDYMMNVWHAPTLGALALAGIMIAVLGALVPAHSAARLTIAKVLHNE